HPILSRADMATLIKVESMSGIANTVKEFLTDPKIKSDGNLLAYLLQLFESEKDKSKQHVLTLASCLSCFYLRLRNDGATTEQKLLMQSEVLKYTRIVCAYDASVCYWLDFFYMSKENHGYKVELGMLDDDKKITDLLAMHKLIEKLEIMLSSEMRDEKTFRNQHLLFIDYCIFVYKELLDLIGDPVFEVPYKKYVLLAATPEHPEYCLKLVNLYVSGKHGFERNETLAREIMLSLPEVYRMREQNILVCVRTYLTQTNPDAASAVALLLEHAPRNPVFYMVLGEFYADGYIGINVDRVLAMKYYNAAIAQNFLEAHVGIGSMLYDDYKLAQGLEEQHAIRLDALRHFEIAYDAASIDAAFYLGKIYLHGLLGVKQDIERGKAYFNFANTNGKQPFAKAMLEMIAAGYQGETPLDLSYEIIRQKSLKLSGYVDRHPGTMFEYGVIELMTDPLSGCQYICKSASYNVIDACHFLAVIQFLLDHQFCNIVFSAVAEINKVDYRHLINTEPPTNLAPYVQNLFVFAKLISRYLARGYTISQEFVLETFMSNFFVEDSNDIEEQIKLNFAPEHILKTRLLVEKQTMREMSGDKVCLQATQQLLSSSKPTSQTLRKKISKLGEDDKISMRCFTDCLNAFFKSGITLQDDDKRAVKAGEHMHPPHGGEHNRNQNLEGGRRETARLTLFALQHALEVDDPDQERKKVSSLK
ncbi:MAG: hypothetical protein M3R00_03430, partial [Pseudomonadota bacterium]|nr:hypothetical protein [Pseudomonadota bacterium]